MIRHKAELENLHLFMEYACKRATDAGVNDTDLMHIELAIEESIVNIINYAFPDSDGHIEMNCEINNNEIIMTISDNGTPFNPLEREDPKIDVPVAERQIGGLGIFLIKNIMNDVGYERKNGCNILTLKKLRAA